MHESHACIKNSHWIKWSRSNGWDLLLLLNLKEMETWKIGIYEIWDHKYETPTINLILWPLKLKLNELKIEGNEYETWDH